MALHLVEWRILLFIIEHESNNPWTCAPMNPRDEKAPMELLHWLNISAFYCPQIKLELLLFIIIACNSYSSIQSHTQLHEMKQFDSKLDYMNNDSIDLYACNANCFAIEQLISLIRRSLSLSQYISLSLCSYFVHVRVRYMYTCDLGPNHWFGFCFERLDSFLLIIVVVRVRRCLIFVKSLDILWLIWGSRDRIDVSVCGMAA